MSCLVGRQSANVINRTLALSAAPPMQSALLIKNLREANCNETRGRRRCAHARAPNLQKLSRQRLSCCKDGVELQQIARCIEQTQQVKIEELWRGVSWWCMTRI